MRTTLALAACLLVFISALTGCHRSGNSQSRTARAQKKPQKAEKPPPAQAKAAQEAKPAEQPKQDAKPAKQPKQEAKPVVLVNQGKETIVWAKLVDGFGQDRANAELHALGEAQKHITIWLRTRQPPLNWTPSVAYIRDHLLVGDPQRSEDKDDGPFPGMKCWEFPFAITANQFNHMVQIERQERQREEIAQREARKEERLLLLGKVLAVVVLLLGGVLLYLRVDEWTQGCCGGWLRVALGGMIVAAGAGLFFLA
jgi:hypothetical protein